MNRSCSTTILPVLHLIQLIRDEAHRFAVTFHRKRRQMRDRSTELLDIPGVGARTTRRLLEHFGSVQAVKQADSAALSSVVTRGAGGGDSGALSEMKILKREGAENCRGVRRGVGLLCDLCGVTLRSPRFKVLG